MRRFVSTAALFLVPLLLALSLVEWRMSLVPNGYSARIDALNRQKDSIETLVVGSSHEYQGVNTDLFERPAFNLAMPSQSLTQSAGIAARYLPQARASGGRTLALPRLRHVLMGIGYFSLPYRMASTTDNRKGFYFRAYRVFGDASWRDRVNPFNYLYTGIYGWGAVQASLFAPRTLDFGGTIGQTGYSPDILPDLPDTAGPDYFAASAATRAAFHHSLASTTSIPANIEALRTLAASCRRAGVQLVLFTSPVTAAYADAFGRDLWNQYRSQIEAFAAANGATYTDYSQDAQFTWRDFGDADHLNPNGAARFSRRLSDRLF